MNYVPLNKIFYSDLESYEAEYNRRINSLSTINFDFVINGNKAFLMIIPELFNKLYEIDKLNKNLSELTENLPGIALNQYVKRCLIEEIVLTNEIEGVISTRQDVFEVLEANKNSKNKRLVGLVTKYLKLNQNEIINIKTCQDIRDIYNDLVLEEILSDDPGNVPDGIFFRKSSVNVVSKFDKVIHRGIMPEAEINKAMEMALEILNDAEINILLRIAVFHYFFGYIHPFYDGNGRTSRFISSYLLSNTLNTLTGYRLAYTIKENINLYYRSFKITNDKKNKGDLTPFVINFFDIIISLLDTLINSISKRYEQLDYYYEISDKLFASKEKSACIAFILFQNTLFGTGGISIDELISASEQSEYTVRNSIKSLEKRNLLIISKTGKKLFYEFDMSKFT